MTHLLSLLPLLAWLACFAYNRCRGLGYRLSFLVACVAWGCAVTILTESLSLFDALTLPWLAAAWTALAVTAAAWTYRCRRSLKASPRPALTGMDRLMVLAIALILACTFLISVVSPPNNTDSMIYHMSRVMHWCQDGSVADYPCSVTRQLDMNPWSEFAILHLQILSGGDRLANLVQWFSMIGSIVAVSLIAALYKVPLRGQLLAALIAATVPMAILQSSSTQNDLAVSFWLLCLVVFGKLSRGERKPRWFLLLSLSLGLALLTKGTAYIYAFPFMLWFLQSDVRISWKSAAYKYAILLLLALSLNIGHFYRNEALFHNPLQSGSDPFSNRYLTPAVVLSNVSRNLALHLMTPSFTVNSYVTGAIIRFNSLLGMDVDDPGTTWPGATFHEKRNRLSPSEDSSGNPLHLYLFGAVLALVVVKKRLWQYLPYATATGTGFLLFCTVLRWQPWASRLHLPLFLLFSPLAGIVVSELELPWGAGLIALILPIASLPWVLFNQSRPLVSLYPLVPNFYPSSILTAPRNSLYFVRNRGTEESFADAASKIKSGGYRHIGIVTDANGFEYPFWALTRTDGLGGPTIEHVQVHNVSATIPEHWARHDAVVSIVTREDRCEATIVKPAGGR